MLRSTFAALVSATAISSVVLFSAVHAQQIAAPVPGVANYDPTLSAKEAVLANWELAAAGIRAGKIMGRDVVAAVDKGLPYRGLSRQAQFAQKTMVQRYNAALWIYTQGTGIEATSEDGTALAAAVGAAFTDCAADTCDTERAALRDAFVEASATLDAASLAAREALTARQDLPDTVLMTEQLGLIADYLDSGAWAQGFALTAFDRDAEEMAARIVGTMSLWRNIEPYVGLANQEIDNAINAASQDLLRTLRRTTRGAGALAADGPEITAVTEKAQILAAEFRRAAALFAV